MKPDTTTIPASALNVFTTTAFSTSALNSNLGYYATNITFPKRSEWYCQLFGSNNDFTYRPLVGKEPNWFWRKMQYLCFGHRWVKERYL